jgi:hypothetical protein
MPLLHSVSYRTSSGTNPLPIGTTRTRDDALSDMRALLREIASERSPAGNSGADLPTVLSKALDSWLEPRIS